MIDQQAIDALIADERYEEAAALLEAEISAAQKAADNPDAPKEAVAELSSAQKAIADLYLALGRLRWRQGERGKAITALEHAVDIDPASPAQQQLELCRDIMDFFDRDQLNP